MSFCFRLCPALRPLRPVLCRERCKHQGQALTGRYAGLDPCALLPAIEIVGAGRKYPGGLLWKYSTKTKQRKQRRKRNKRKKRNKRIWRKKAAQFFRLFRFFLNSQRYMTLLKPLSKSSISVSVRGVFQSVFASVFFGVISESQPTGRGYTLMRCPLPG